MAVSSQQVSVYICDCNPHIIEIRHMLLHAPFNGYNHEDYHIEISEYQSLEAVALSSTRGYHQCYISFVLGKIT